MKIVILQPMLKLYRVSLYETLHQLLSQQGHELRVVFGTPSPQELQRGDNTVLTNKFCFFESSYWLFNGKLHIVPNALKHILWADIIITEQANKHLHNYLLIILRLLKIKPFAFWGHGLNRQAQSKSILEYIKRKLATQTDWWFAYTQSVGDYLQELGFNTQQITVLNNSIDTQAFKQTLQQISPVELQAFKQQYNIPANAQVGLFCGSLHKHKKIEFLLAAAVYIKNKLPNFYLLIGGDGDQKSSLASYADRYDFIIPLGRLSGQQKSLAFKTADLILNPGMVGLVILDAFSAGLPILTTIQPDHSPEIDYLQHGYNGLISTCHVADYAELVINTFTDPAKLALLKKHALLSSSKFSIEKMAKNFADGIAHCHTQLQNRRLINSAARSRT